MKAATNAGRRCLGRCDRRGAQFELLELEGEAATIGGYQVHVLVDSAPQALGGPCPGEWPGLENPRPSNPIYPSTSCWPFLLFATMNEVFGVTACRSAIHDWLESCESMVVSETGGTSKFQSDGS